MVHMCNCVSLDNFKSSMACVSGMLSVCYAEMVYTGLWRDAYKYNLGRIIRTYSLDVDRTLQNHTIYVLEEDHLYAYMVSV